MAAHLELAASGFVASTDGGGVRQPASAIVGIGLAFALVPAGFVLLGAGLLRGYRT